MLNWVGSSWSLGSSISFLLCFSIFLFFFALNFPSFLYSKTNKENSWTYKTHWELTYPSRIDEPYPELLSRQPSEFSQLFPLNAVGVGIAQMVFKPLHEHFNNLDGVIWPRSFIWTPWIMGAASAPRLSKLWLLGILIFTLFGRLWTHFSTSILLCEGICLCRLPNGIWRQLLPAWVILRKILGLGVVVLVLFGAILPWLVPLATIWLYNFKISLLLLKSLKVCYGGNKQHGNWYYIAML